MPFVRVKLRPGITRNTSKHAAEGTWYDCDKVRFQDGLPEKIGGWSKFVNASFLGIGRKMHDWVTISGSRYLAVGTTYKLYANDANAAYYDITPIRSTVTLGTDPITTTNGTGEIDITATAHGAVKGDYVTISGATTTNGIPDTDINIEHKIVAVPDANTITVICATAASSSATGGGSSVEAAFQVNIGLDSYVPGSGYGSGSWGSGSWGGGSSLSASAQLRLWTMDNFGDDLVANIRQGGIYFWDESSGTSTRAVPISSLTRRSVTLGASPIATATGSATITITDNGGHGAGVGDYVTIAGASTTNGIPAGEINARHQVQSTPTETTFTVDCTTNATGTGSGGGSSVTAAYEAGEYYAPSGALQVMVSPVARHVIAFGCTPIGSSSIDPMFVRWCTSENLAEWRPTPENSAGGQRLSAGSRFIGAVRTRQEVLIWTDAGMASMRYVGGDFVFQFTEIANGVSMISPNAAVVTHGHVFFMDRGAFYAYSGSAKRLNCTVRDYVFDDLDVTQSYKIFAGVNANHSEIMWFYPSESSGTGEIDRYVMYNFVDDVWTYGTLPRGFWLEAPTKDNPLAASLRRYTLGTDPITTTSASATISINHTDHGLSAGEYVILSGASSVGGIGVNVLNAQHAVAAVTDDDNYTITLPDTATSSATGGGTPTAIYSNYVYKHEDGHDADGDAMTAYVESADMSIGEGDHFWFVDRIVPDIEFVNSSDNMDTVTVTLKGHDHYGNGDRTLSTISVTPTTEQFWVRGRARHLIFRIESSGSGYGWRVGFPRVDGRPDGRR